MFAPRVTRAQTKAAAGLTGEPALQRAMPVTQSLGNQATLHLLAQQTRRSTETQRGDQHELQNIFSARPAAGAATSGASWDFSRISVHSPERATATDARVPLSAPRLPAPMVLQPKLLVGAVDDPLEREADSMADQIAQSGAPDAAAPEKFGVARGRREATGRATATASGSANFAAATPLVNAALARPGSPLDGESRSAFGSRFGRDFSAVRVHTDSAAAASARALSASAYTVADNIVFGEGKFEPRSPAGRRLLAHELTHVVQQSGLPRTAPHRDDGTRQAEPTQPRTTPDVSPAGASPGCLIQRAPPDPPAPVPETPILGSTDPAAETESLFHYGDLTGKDSFRSTRDYPRLTDCGTAESVEEAAKYTGTPVRESVKFRYELKVERGFFSKNFKNVATRHGGYSEFATDQPIPVKFFRKVATLLRGPPGGAPLVPGGGTGGGAAGGAAASRSGASAAKPPSPAIVPKPGQLAPNAEVGGGAEVPLGKSIPTEVPGPVAQGAVEGGLEGAASGAAVRAVVTGGLRFLGGLAIGVAIGIIVGLAYSYLTRKLIEGDIAKALGNIPADKEKRIQARIDALPAGKKKFARVTLDYIIWRSTLGPIGPPPAYQMDSVTLIGVHPGNEELDFPASTDEKLGEILLGAQKVTVRISYTVPIDQP